MTTQQADLSAVVRERTTDDLADCAKTLRVVHAMDGYPVEGVADPIAWLWPDGLLCAWVALNGEQVAGHAAVSTAGQQDAAAEFLRQRDQLTPDAPIAVLGRLFVHPAARGQHLGRHLVTAATHYAQHHDMRLVLDVMTKDTAAIRLYESLNWQHLGTTTHHYGHNQHAPAYCYTAPTTSGTSQTSSM